MNNYNIINLSEIDSTNNYTFTLKDTSLFKEGLVITTKYQTAGRGYFGNIWESEKAKNIIISILIEPKIHVDKIFDISKLASLTLIDFLLSKGLNSQIKWPNDILVNSKKIAGILIQNIISNNIVTHSVIGLGLNVNQVVFKRYSPLATSLKLEANKDFNLVDIQKSILNYFDNRLNDYRSKNTLNNNYLNALFQKDKLVFFKSESKKFKGIIRGINDSGLLQVESDDLVKEYDIKDIKMIF